MSLLLPLALLMQVGADPHVYPQAPLPSIVPHRQTTKPVPVAPVDQLAECMARGRDDADAGLAFAREWLARAKAPEDRAQPNQCLGELLTDQGEFAEAQTAFAAAVEAIPQAQAAGAVPLMAMAGNAALAAGDGARALAWFDRALAVSDYDNPGGRGAILADRARALVAQGRTAEAAAALTQARQQAPGDASVFLLSATLARRQHDLRSAQGFIETAAGLDPVDPAIGLEAGVIAVLAGHDAAARKSWNSVITAAPDSAEARTARGYLAQLGAELLIVTNGNMDPYGSTHRTAILARAQENQAFALMVNRVGEGDGGLLFAGGSALVDPFGSLVFEAGREEGQFTVQLDLAQLVAARRDYRYLDDQRLRLSGEVIEHANGVRELLIP